MAPSPGTARALRILKRTGIVVVALVIGILLAEGGLRLFLRVKGTPFDAQESRVRMRTLLSPIQRFVPANLGIDLPDGGRRPILNPFYGSEEHYDTGDVFKHFREDARPDDFEVLLLGGSVAAYLGLTDGPAMRDEFQQYPALRGRRVVFLNGAHAAHKQPQQVTRVALLLTFGYRPDLVINLDGFNEMALAAENSGGNMHPLWPSAPVWGAVVSKINFAATDRMELLVGIWQLREESEALLSRCVRFQLDKTALGSRYAIWRLESMNRKRNTLQEALMGIGTAVDTDIRSRRQQGGPDYDQDIGSVLDVAVHGWSESSRSLRALCESRGIPYVHYIQPALFDTGSKPMSEAEGKIENPRDLWLFGARDGYPLLRKAAAELAAEGEHVIDGTRIFEGVTETLYVDPCHVNPRGNQLLREFMMARFPRDVIPAR